MHFGSSRRAAAGLLFALAASTTGIAHAADVNGRIRGTVTDPQDAVVPGVTVIATNQATGVKFTTKTGTDGAYLFAQLPVGTYTVTVAAPGFQGFKASGILITIDQEYVEAIHLGVGSATETLEVAADAVQVNTSDMQLNNIVDSRQMVELPLIGRNFAQLALIEPGVQGASDRFGLSSVSGAESQQSEFMINGADINDIALNSQVVSPNLDAIDQFNLIDGPLNAEYDRNSGGIISATIKQGTNHFHGDVFEFYRDTFLNTLNYFQKSVSTGTGTKSKYHQNIFGGTIGGPVLKDKLFFFGAYQGTRQIVPQTGGNVTVYSAADLAGNFSEDLAPAGQNPRGSTLALSSKPIPAGITIPAGCTAGEAWNACLTPSVISNLSADFNPITSALAKKYVPAANSGTYNYIFSPVTTTTQDQAIGRVDYSLNPANQFTGLFLYQRQVASDTLPFTGATVPGFGDQNISHVNQGTFDFVHQFSATLVNDLALHYTRFNYVAVSPQNVVAPSSLGFAINPQDVAAESVPTLTVSGFFELGFSTNGPQPRIDQVAQINDNVSKTIGSHTLKFGYDGRRFNVSNPFFANNSGSYGFARTTASIYSTGDPSLDFLLGIPSGYAQGSGATIQADAFLNYIYAQDTWKVTNSFTIDYGLGYSIDTPLRNHQYNGEGIACFTPGAASKIFPTAPTGVQYPGDPGCTTSAQAYTHYNEFGPRIGFAWSPDLGVISAGNSHKFSIRGGFGVYYNRSEEESALQTLETPPFGQSSAGIADYSSASATYRPTIANPYQDINSGFTKPNKFPFVPPAPGSAVDYTPFLPMEISTYGPSFRAPYAENYQLTVEREFPARIVTRVSYVGTAGHREQNTYEANYITPAGHAACLADPACYNDPDDQLGNYPSHSVGNNGSLWGIGTVGSNASSNYNALQIGIQKATTHGLSFQVSYTLSHALDTASSFENAGFGGSNGRGYNQYQPTLNYGNSSYDARHRFVFAPIYITPILKSSSWYSPKNLALSGWEISGVTTLATGFPFDISYGGADPTSLWCSDDDSFYACPNEPNLGGALARSNPRIRSSSTGYTNWFQNQGFSDPALGTFGTLARNAFHGPGINNTDLVIAKNFNVSSDGERRLQLRLTSGNVFNHTNFGLPDGNINDPTFGQITAINSNLPARQTQISGKFYF